MAASGVALEPGLFGQIFGRAGYSTENSEEPVPAF